MVPRHVVSGLQPPIDVGRPALLLGKCRHDAMFGRELADRIGGARIARERERLTLAAAEILLPPRTARARLLNSSASSTACCASGVLAFAFT